MANRRIRRNSKFSEYLIAATGDLTQMQRKPNSIQLGRGAVTSTALAGQVVLTDNVIQSNNYVPGATGWIIDGAGNAEFGNVYVRGDINAQSGSIGYWNISEPVVTRTFGNTTLYGTVIESQNIGSTDSNVTSGAYVSLFKSYVDIPEQIDSASRSGNLATLTIQEHNYIVGDYVNISIPNDTSYDDPNALILGITDSTITYQNVGSDSPDTSITGTANLNIDDVAGLYLRDYGKLQFDYGYFSNKGVSYVSAEDINVIENPSFEYSSAFSNVSWSAGTGLNFNSRDFSASNFKSSSSYGANVWWTSSVSTYFTGNIDYAAGNAYTLFNTSRGLYFGFTIFPNYTPTSLNLTSSSISTYNLLGNITSAVANTTTITYTGSGLNFSAGQYVTVVSGTFSNPVYNIKDQEVLTANSTTLTVAGTGASYNVESVVTTNNISTGLLKVLVSSGSTFSGGDVAFLDVDAGIYNTTYGEVTNYYSPHTIADGTQGHTYVVASSPSPNATAFYLQTEYGSIESTGTVLQLSSHYSVNSIARSQKVYKVYETALDLSAVTIGYPGTSNTTSISDVLSSGTSALWNSDSKNKYYTSTANSYMLGYLDFQVDVSAMSKPSLVVLDSLKIAKAYLANDPTNYALNANIKVNIPGWIVSHDGSGTVPSSPVKIANVGYVLDNFYLSTASNFFYGSALSNNRWYTANSSSVITDPSQASIEGTKTWLDINLDNQSAHLDYFDYIKFRSGSFSDGMAVRPSLTVLDTSSTIVKFPDATYETTTLTGGAYQYSSSTTSNRNIDSSLKLLTGGRSSAFQLSALASDININTAASTVITGAVISGVFDQNNGQYSTVYVGSDKFVWTAYPAYLETDALSSVIFTDTLATFNQKILGLGGFTGSTLRLTTTTGLSLTSTGHAFQIGDSSTANMRIDSNEIQAVNSNAATLMYVNRSGGDVQIGNTTSTVTVPGSAVVTGNITSNLIRLQSVTSYDLSLSSTNHAFQIGPTSGANMRIDANEVQAVNSGAAASLYLQNSGGSTIIGVGGGDVIIGNATSSTNLILGSTGGTPIAQIFYKWAYTSSIGNSKPLSIASTGLVGYSGSSKDFKQDIEDLIIDTANVLAVTPKKFRYKVDVERLGDEAEISYGFIAEDLDDLGLDPFVDYDDSGKPVGIDYPKYVVALQAVIKDQNAKILSLSDRLDALEGK